VKIGSAVVVISVTQYHDTSLSMIFADIDFDYVNFVRYDLKVKYVRPI
jgi:hypothetical protein